MEVRAVFLYENSVYARCDMSALSKGNQSMFTMKGYHSIPDWKHLRRYNPVEKRQENVPFAGSLCRFFMRVPLKPQRVRSREPVC